VLRVFRKIKNRFLRISVIVVVILILFGGVVIAFISPIAKYIIEKNSVKLIGRQIDIGLLYINPFTGHVYAHNVVMYEKNSGKKFVSIGGLSVNISVRRLLSKEIYFSSVSLDHVWANIVQNKSHFNFDDILRKNSPKTTATSKPPHYYVHDITLTNSEVDYSELSIPVHYYVTKLNAQCPLIEWDIDSSSYKFSLTFLKNSGDIKGLFTLNFKTLAYDTKIVLAHVDLRSLDQYIKEISNYENFSAFLNADMNVSGNFNSVDDFLATGKTEITDFHFGKSLGDDYLRFSKLTMDADTLSPINTKFFYKSLLLDSLYVKYERYDSLDNFTRMFGENGANVTAAKAKSNKQNIIFLIAQFISDIAKDVINSAYRVKEFQVTNSRAVFNDYSLIERFSLHADPIVITAKNIDSKANRMYVTLQTKVNPFGTISANFDANPSDFGDFNLTYSITGFPIPLFNPYTVTYTSHPFDKGTLDLNGNWHVVNKQISSINHVIVTNPTLAVRIKNEDAKKIPMRLILFFVRDVNRQIDIELPITGDLGNPKYHLWGEILNVLENVAIKPPFFPYTSVKLAQVKDDDDYLAMEWQLTQSKMSNEQSDQLKKISHYLSSHPNSQVTIVPHNFESEEKETLLINEAKKQFYSAQHHIPLKSLTKDDSIAISKISIKDASFRRYIKVMTKDTMDFTAQGKCLKLIGKAQVDNLYAKLLNERKNQIMSFFNDKNIANRVTFEKGVKEIPTTGFSHYLFYYKGDSPPVPAKQ
jgi:hypothetical protein